MSYRYYRNESCEYYPCHKGIPDEEFNCLFCYCPLYCYGNSCGGILHYGNGVKDCSACALPHERKHYDYIIGRLKALAGQSNNCHER